MSRRSRVLTGLGVAAGAAVAGYGAARWAVRRSRARHDPHAGRAFEPVVDAEHEVETADGTRLRVVERGEGAPVVLVHGVTNDLRTWFHQIEDLPAHGIRAVAYDQRGHGRSTVGDAGFGTGPLADDLRSVLERLDLRGAVIVGHSMGGMAVQAFACNFPEVVQERVAGIVLVGTSSHALRFWRTFERIPPRLLDRGDVWFDRVLLHEELGYLATRVGLGRRPHASHVELVRRMVLETPPDVRRRAIEGLMTHDVREMLCDVSVPVLVLCGTRDLLTPLAASRRIVSALGDAELRVVPGAGHMPMLEAADEVTKAVAEFVEMVSAA